MQYFLIATMLAKCMRETYESIDMVIQDKMSILQSELENQYHRGKEVSICSKIIPQTWEPKNFRAKNLDPCTALY